MVRTYQSIEPSMSDALMGRLIDPTLTQQTQAEQLLVEISRIQEMYIRDQDPEQIFEQLLSVVLRLTESEYGFIGEIHHELDGTPFLKTHAITNIAWTDDLRSWFDENAPDGLEFKNLETLFGAVMVDGRVVLANEPSKDPRAGGIPEGHPPLLAFLGMPFFGGEEMVGMVGLANRPGGYDQHIVDLLQPILTTCSAIIVSVRSDRQRRQASSDASTMNAILGGVLDAAREAVILTDGTGSIRQVNRSTSEMFRSDADEVIGAPIGSLVAPHHLDVIATQLKVVHGARERDTGDLIELDAVRSDGTEFPVEISIGAVELPDGEAYVTVWRDITARRASDEALTRAQQLLESTPDFIGWANTDGKVLFINQGGRTLVGLSANEDVIGRSVGDFAPPWAQQLIQQVAIPEAIKSGVWSGESAYLDGDGIEVPVSQVVNAHRDPDGDLRFISTIARDLRERHEIERMKDEFVSTVSHELRTPLTAISGYAELLIDESLGGLTAEQTKALEVVDRNASRLRALVDDLLTIAVVDHRVRTPRGAPVDIADLLKRVASSFEPTVDPLLHSLVFEIPDEHAAVLGDAAELENVLGNLLSNALKFSPDGGTVTVRLTVNGDAVRVDVEDEGIGIPIEELDHLSNRFLRSSRAIEAAIPGTGLGLAIVSSIIDRHGGSLEITAPPSGGTLVSIALPVAHSASSFRAA